MSTQQPPAWTLRTADREAESSPFTPIVNFTTGEGGGGGCLRVQGEVRAQMGPNPIFR
jgi:hypothetical protein